MNFGKTETFLVAQRRDGKFLSLQDDGHATSAFWTGDPSMAEKFRYAPGDKIHDAGYYFEPSTRAAHWGVPDCKMVVVEVRTVCEWADAVFGG